MRRRNGRRRRRKRRTRQGLAEDRQGFRISTQLPKTCRTKDRKKQKKFGDDSELLVWITVHKADGIVESWQD